MTNVTVERECLSLCSNSPDCRWYTWYEGSQSPLGQTCLLLSRCEVRSSLCSSCHTAPVPCSLPISPPPPQGLLISGGAGPTGDSVEVFLPSTGQHCRLPAMPGEERVDHSMEGLTVCGGYNTQTSCISLSEGVSAAGQGSPLQLGLQLWRHPAGREGSQQFPDHGENTTERDLGWKL